MRTINHRGTTINVIENEFWAPNHNLGAAFNEDFLYVSNGFMTALENGLMPVKEITVLDTNKYGEWHHIFIKQDDGSFEASYVRFN